MSSAPTSPRWWLTQASGSPLRARLAAAAIALALVAVSVLVWTSPGIGDDGEDVVVADPEAELRAQIAALEKQLEIAEADRPQAFPRLPREEDAADEPEDGAEDDAAGADPGADAGPGGAGPGAAAPPASRGERRPDPREDVPADSDGPANPSNPVLPGPDPEPTTPPTQRPDDADEDEPEPSPAPTTPPLTAPTKAELLARDTRFYGMYTMQSPFNWAELDDVATKTGVLPDLAGYFQGWDRPFRADAIERSWRRGMLPLLTWESRPSGSPNNRLTEEDYSLPIILSGRYDDYIRSYARGIADLGVPVVIRLNHEMNGDWYPWSELTKEGRSINGNRPGDYAAVWRHVHGIFAEEGANEHVIWLWAPNIVNNLPELLRTPEHLARLYPGDEYVDWVGLSGYYRPPFREGQTPTFDYTFGLSLGQLRDLTDKPIFLAEIGASEVGGKKPEWIRSLFEGLARPENDDVVGFAWFNLTVTSTVRGELTTNDWRVISHSRSLAAFKEGLRLPGARMGGTAYP